MAWPFCAGRGCIWQGRSVAQVLMERGVWGGRGRGGGRGEKERGIGRRRERDEDEDDDINAAEGEEGWGRREKISTKREEIKEEEEVKGKEENKKSK